MRTLHVAFMGILLHGIAAWAWAIHPGSPIDSQHLFLASFNYNDRAAVPEGDPAGHPNIATKVEVTSPLNSTLFCAREGDKHSSGYAHFTNALGKEDKHMFWMLLEARNDPENAPVILYFGGGPGTSGLGVPFSGQGPCTVITGKDGEGEGIPSEFAWTEFAHILAIDQPVGTGFSYGERSSFRNSSERAGWDVDDFLQAFWRENPNLAKNQFAIGAGSYGSTYIPNIVNVIRNRNIQAASEGNSSRLIKMPDAAMISNPGSDPVSMARYSHVVSCDDFNYFNETMCESISDPLSSIGYSELCQRASPWVNDTSGINPYDARLNCSINVLLDCFPELQWVKRVMNDTRLRDAFGVPHDFPYKALALEEINIPFEMNGDISQRAYKLLGPAVDDGMRLLVYNGIEDAYCASRATEAWLRLLSTRHQEEFRNAPEIDWPGVGSFYTAGIGGAGEYAFVKIKDAGHLVITLQQKKTQDLIRKWLKNEQFVQDMQDL